jgi:hypothetical protein
MSETTIQQSTGDTRHKIAFAAGIALLVAGVLLLTLILPAEYAVDPLGTGRRLGLIELGDVGKQVAAIEGAKAAGGSQAAIIVPQEAKFSSETVEFRLEPKGSMEYKYRLDKGESLLFSWTATSTVNYEFHAEPDGAPRGYAQSYEKSTGATKSGTLIAPFPGITDGTGRTRPTSR